MPPLDVEALLAPLSEDAPCGPSVEYDERYVELERLARGVAQEENAEGKIIREAEPPDWPEIERIALELTQESKDLRVAIYLARARLAGSGLAGFHETLDLMGGYISRYWDSVHPQLDADDDHDPSIRVNTLVALCDNTTILRALRMAPLTQSRQFGRISFRDYAVANGLMPPPSTREDGEKLPDASRIEAAFAETANEELQATLAAATGSLKALKAVDKTLDEAIGAGNGPDFAPLEKLLGEIKGLLEKEAAKRGGGEGEDATEEGEMASEGAEAGAGSKRGLAVSGAVRSRDDVLLLIDKICRYYADFEPSSPVPLILTRTKRLVTMSFLDILKELTPGGVSEFGVIAGIKEEE